MANLWLQYGKAFCVALGIGVCGCYSDGTVPYESSCLCDLPMQKIPATAALPQACFWTHRGDGYDGTGSWHIAQDDRASAIVEREETALAVEKPSPKPKRQSANSAKEKRIVAMAIEPKRPNRDDESIGQAHENAEACIDINVADAEALTRLPGIGKTRAEAIIATRTKRPFRKPSSIVRVKGIGPKAYQKMAPHICPF